MDWMQKLPENLKKKPLFELALPGSHDSCAFWLDKTGPLCPGEPSIFELFKGVVYNWSITQKENIGSQLRIGIRYFDLRVAPKPHSNELYLVHGLYGSEVSEVLAEINKFLEDQPDEVIILDFNHLLSFTQQHHAKLQHIIKACFGDKLCHREPNLLDLTLNNLNKSSKQVIIFYHFPNNEDFLWPSNLIDSPWPNLQDADKLLTNLKTALKNKPNNVFYISQGVMTPDTSTIMCNLLGNLLSWQSALKRLLISWLQSSPNINIVIMDDCDSTFANQVIQMNKA